MKIQVYDEYGNLTFFFLTSDVFSKNHFFI